MNTWFLVYLVVMILLGLRSSYWIRFYRTTIGPWRGLPRYLLVLLIVLWPALVVLTIWQTIRLVKESRRP